MRVGIGIGISALLCAMAITATALGDSAYTVEVRVAAHSGSVNTRRRVAASGQAANAGQLSVYLAPAKCVRRRSAEARLPKVKLIISATVVGIYTQSKIFTGRGIGRHYACAYLTGLAPNPGVRYAAAHVSYRVTAS